LLHALHILRYTCVAAHVNYGLREQESDGDELCVVDFCSKLSIAFELLRVSDEDWKVYEGSVQEAARNMRYDWFNQLLTKHKASVILTAHHANDQTETMLYQFVRGGSGKSIYGMPEKTGNLIRPMLGISKARVVQYVEECSIPWRNDSSNESIRYARNVVRLEWMPLIERVNPTIHDTIQQRSAWMHQEQAMVDHCASEFLKQNVKLDGATEVMTVGALLSSGYGDVVLWKWLSTRGFSSPQVVQIAEHMREEPSQEAVWFYSPTHQTCLQGESIACMETVERKPEFILSLPWSNAFVSIDYCPATEVEYTSDERRQYLDASQVKFPMTIRTRLDGDRFHPLGAPGQQKVSDFLMHVKIPAWRKLHVMLLETKEEVAAVLQYRISENFKKTETTQRCVRIQFL
jgi:tRNA(Ile)-lysidine synthase